MFDLPDAPRPDADTPAPARLLYDFDNLLLSYADRSRIVSDEHRDWNFPVTNAMPSVVLIDGFTAGTWKITRRRGRATLAIQPFERRFTPADADAVTTEGAGLLAFAALDDLHDIEFVAPEAPWIGLPN